MSLQWAWDRPGRVVNLFVCVWFVAAGLNLGCAVTNQDSDLTNHPPDEPRPSETGEGVIGYLTGIKVSTQDDAANRNRFIVNSPAGTVSGADGPAENVLICLQRLRVHEQIHVRTVAWTLSDDAGGFRFDVAREEFKPDDDGFLINAAGQCLDGDQIIEGDALDKQQYIYGLFGAGALAEIVLKTDLNELLASDRAKP